MAEKKVLITQRKGQPNESVREVALLESSKQGCRYHLPKGRDGFHFDKLESVERFFRRKYPKADIEIQ